MQFTTTEEHAELVEQAKALLSHGSPKVTLGELHLQAMRLLVAALERKRFGAKPEARKPSRPPATRAAPKPPRQRGRAIPALVRRQVYERDQGRCTFTDDCGRRCSDHLIQLHRVVRWCGVLANRVAGVRAAEFNHDAPCELELYWSPLPQADCGRAARSVAASLPARP